jgi:hypothetical protein
MNITTRRHAKKSPVAVVGHKEGFGGGDNKHPSVSGGGGGGGGQTIIFLVKNRRRLLLVAVVILVAGMILFTNVVVWRDIRHSPRMRQPSKKSSLHYFQSKARPKKAARRANSHQQQQLRVQEDVLSVPTTTTTSPPRGAAADSDSSCSAKSYNFLFPQHGCFDNEMAGRVHCRFRSLQIDLTKIHAKRMGGESLASSMGQEESDEFLTYEPGAFVVHEPLEETPSTEQRHKKYWHYMNDVSAALVYSKNATTAGGGGGGQIDVPIKCDQTWPGVTLFITRYEYVNLYHTMTDWWNTYFTMTAEPQTTNTTKINIVFLDAHPAGNLDPVWEQLFGGGKVSFLRRLPGNHICFEEARFIPAGYTAPIYPKDSENCPPDPQYTRKFVNHVLNVYNLTHVHRIPGHVVAIERVPYISHPRSKPSNTERLLSNLRHLAMMLPKTVMAQLQRSEQEQGGHDTSLLSLFKSPSTTNTLPKVTVKVVTLVNDTMRDQIAEIRQAHVLLANHGAGLTHLLFLDDGAHIIELNCNHGFFVQLARWRGGGGPEQLRHYCQGFVDGGESISERFWKDNVEWVIANRVFSTAASST